MWIGAHELIHLHIKRCMWFVSCLWNLWFIATPAALAVKLPTEIFDGFQGGREAVQWAVKPVLCFDSLKICILELSHHADTGSAWVAVISVPHFPFPWIMFKPVTLDSPATLSSLLEIGQQLHKLLRMTGWCTDSNARQVLLGRHSRYVNQIIFSSSFYSGSGTLEGGGLMCPDQALRSAVYLQCLLSVTKKT